MKKNTKIELSYFDENLWSQSIAERNKTMTPLYIERYHGIRCAPHLTYHAHWEFSVHISGNGIIIADENQEILPDSVILIPPNLGHREAAQQKVDSIWLGFKADLPEIKHDKMLAIRSQEMVQQFISIWSFAKRTNGPIGPELDGKLLALTGCFFRKLATKQTLTPMQQAVDYFHEHFQDTISMSDIAEQLKLSEGHFYRQFKEFTGETPINYLNNIRLKNAALHLSNSTLPIKEIATVCGFNDPYYFSRIFSKETGMSPKRFREKKQNV